MIYILPRLREPATLFNAKANYLNTLCEFVLTLMIRSTFDVFSRMSMVASNAFFVHGFSMCIYFYYFPLSSFLVTNTSPKSSLIFFCSKMTGALCYQISWAELPQYFMDDHLYCTWEIFSSAMTDFLKASGVNVDLN